MIENKTKRMKLIFCFIAKEKKRIKKKGCTESQTENKNGVNF